jgi:hypothetical protein
VIVTLAFGALVLFAAWLSRRCAPVPAIALVAMWAAMNAIHYAELDAYRPIVAPLLDLAVILAALVEWRRQESMFMVFIASCSITALTMNLGYVIVPQTALRLYVYDWAGNALFMAQCLALGGCGLWDPLRRRNSDDRVSARSLRRVDGADMGGASAPLDRRIHPGGPL